MTRGVALVLVLVLVLGCSRSTTTSTLDASPSALASATAPSSATATASAAPSPKPSASATFPTPIAPIEAKVSHPKKPEDDPAIAHAIEPLKKHFGGALPASLAAQSAELTVAHRRALLVTDDAKPFAERSPFVIAAREDGTTLWTKERPVAGIMAPIGPIAIAAGPRGRVALAACDPPTSAVAIRLWDEDGAPFADFAAMDVDACDAISILYWPRKGWVVVAAKSGATRAQLLTDEGTLSWQRGVDVGARPRVAWPVSLAADSDSSFVLVQRAQADRPGAPDRVLAFRYDTKAAPLWEHPVDLGEARVPAGERIVLARPRAGVVRVTIGPGADVEVASSGEITRP